MQKTFKTFAKYKSPKPAGSPANC